MNDDLRAGMAEATRLTLAGRLAEATAAIQRTLGNLPAPDVVATDPGGASAPSGPFRPVDDSAPAIRTPGRATVSRTGAPTVAAAPPRPCPNVRRQPAGGPGAPDRERPATSDRVPSP